MGLRILTARRARFVPLVAWLTASCQSLTPTVDSISFDTLPEHTARTMVLVTSQCAPPFDIDRAVVADDPDAVLELDPGTRLVPAMRTGDELFEAAIPDDLAAGTYELLLHLHDGRAARFGGQLTVQSASQAVLVVTGLHPDATMVRAGEAFTVTVQVQNQAHAAVTMQTLAVRSTPDAVSNAASPTLGEQSLAPGETGSYDVRVVVAVGTAPGAALTLSIAATARDALGALYTTTATDPPASVTVAR